MIMVPTVEVRNKNSLIVINHVFNVKLTWTRIGPIEAYESS